MQPATARKTDGLRIDCYDNPGDYLGSGIDGLEDMCTETPRTSFARSPKGER